MVTSTSSASLVWASDSAFMVASKVRVVSRAFGEQTAHVWESDGLEGYTIEDGERAEHGTDVT